MIPRLSSLYVLSCALSALMLAACAQATTEGGDDDDDIGGVDAAAIPDAPTGGFADARIETQIDAPVSSIPDANTGGIPDAPPMGTPDAPPGTGLFCNNHSECTNADECCFYLVQPPGFCVIGDVDPIFQLCIPAG